MCVFKYHAFIYFLRPPPWYGTVAMVLQCTVRSGGGRRDRGWRRWTTNWSTFYRRSTYAFRSYIFSTFSHKRPSTWYTAGGTAGLAHCQILALVPGTSAFRYNGSIPVTIWLKYISVCPLQNGTNCSESGVDIRVRVIHNSQSSILLMYENRIKRGIISSMKCLF